MPTAMATETKSGAMTGEYHQSRAPWVEKIQAVTTWMPMANSRATGAMRLAHLSENSWAIIDLDRQPAQPAGQFGQHQDIEIDCRGQGIEIEDDDIPDQRRHEIGMQEQIIEADRFTDIRQDDEHRRGDIGKGGQRPEFGQGFEFFHPEEIDRRGQHQAAGGIADKEGQTGDIEAPAVGVLHIGEDQTFLQLIEPDGHGNQENHSAEPHAYFHFGRHGHTSLALGGR